MNIIIDGPLFRRPRYMTPERTAYLRANRFVSSDILAANLGLDVRWTNRYLRLLGLRKCKSARRSYDPF